MTHGTMSLKFNLFSPQHIYHFIQLVGRA